MPVDIFASGHHSKLGSARRHGMISVTLLLTSDLGAELHLQRQTLLLK
jgi:hypothetical protein